MPDDGRLDAALRELGPLVAFPPAPDLRPGLAERLAEPRRRGVRWRPALVLAVVVTLLAASVAAAVILGLAGLRITLTDVLPSADAQTASLAGRFGLGERVTLVEAETRTTLGAPWPRALREPDEVYVAGDGEIVSLVYAAGEELPPLAGSDVGLLVMAIDGSVDPDRIGKLVHEVEATVAPVSVAGARGYWIEGRPHVMRYETSRGADGEVVSRLVGDVLVWEGDGVLYRIETALGLADTLRIAESMADG